MFFTEFDGLEGALVVGHLIVVIRTYYNALLHIRVFIAFLVLIVEYFMSLFLLYLLLLLLLHLILFDVLLIVRHRQVLL